VKTWKQLKFLKTPDAKALLELEGLPPKEKRLRAFDLTPFDKTKVVILGQDPYHTKGLADGLAFSVPPHIHHLPPTLKNIFREYSDDLGHPTPSHGDLSGWARQGVLLLNTALSVEEGKPRSHKNIGWEELIYEVIRKLSNEKSNVVFFLWGKDAQEFKGIIDTQKHLVLETSHPSPLSCHKGFFGSKPFSKTNEYFRGLDAKPIEWKLP
jgi:uracil-DNA glycosylase